MIDLKVKDKYELLALHNALMEAKFNPEPRKPEIQISPFVADFMNQVVDELEKINWATKADIQFKKMEYKNEWREWRESPSDYVVLPSLKSHLNQINACGKDERASLLNLLFSPYKVSQEQAEEFVESAKKEI